MPRLPSLAVALALSISVPALATASPDPEHVSTKNTQDFSEYVPGAAALEGRIMAPCCWQQTLDIHGSEIANELRLEIRQRLKAGETQDAIQADLVNRYGSRILAVPPGNPLKDVGVLLSLAFGGAGIGLGFMLLRWRKRTVAARAAELDSEKKSGKSGKKKAGGGRDRWDEQIDEELEGM